MALYVPVKAFIDAVDFVALQIYMTDHSQALLHVRPFPWLGGWTNFSLSDVPNNLSIERDLLQAALSVLINGIVHDLGLQKAILPHKKRKKLPLLLCSMRTRSKRAKQSWSEGYCGKRSSVTSRSRSSLSMSALQAHPGQPKETVVRKPG